MIIKKTLKNVKKKKKESKKFSVYFGKHVW